MPTPSCPDKMNETRQELNKVMNIARDNVEKLLIRSNRLENLNCRAEVLDMAAADLHHCAREMRIKQDWKANFHKYLAASIVVACVLSVVGIIFF